MRRCFADLHYIGRTLRSDALGKKSKPGKMHFLLVRERAKTWKNCKTWKHDFFAALWEGPNAIQRHPSLSQTLEKLQNLEKCIFCWFPGRSQRYPTLSVLLPDPRKIAKPGKMHFLLICGRAKIWKNYKTWKNAALREGPNAIQRYPSLSQTLENCKTWKNAFFAGFRERFNAIQRYPSLSQTLEKLQNLEKCIFCWFPGRVQRYPTLSVLISDPRKIAKPGKMHFLLVCGRAKTWKNCKTWKNAFFAALRGGPNAIQRYPSLSQTLRKLQNMEKCIFLLVSGKGSTLSNAIISHPRKIAKPGKMHFLLLCGRSQNLEKLQKLEKCIFC